MARGNMAWGVVLGVALLALSSCSSVRRELGIDRNSPDEFTVVKRAPLTLPPDYTLRPPAAPGAASGPFASAPSQTAAAAVLGDAVAAQPAAPAASDQTFLSQLGVDAARSDIRRQIDDDNGVLALQNRSLSDRLIFWNTGDDDAPVSASDAVPTSVIDAKKEAERLKANQAAGQPVNTGKVPTIEKKKSTIERLF